MNLLRLRAVALVAAVALLVVAFTVHLVVRAANAKGRLLAAVGLLVSVALVATSVMALSNRTMGWVKTTGDLWDVIKVDFGVVDGDVDVLASDSVDEDAVQSGPQSDAAAGSSVFTEVGTDLWHADLTGARSGITSSVTVWAPPGWESSSTPLDVVVFLHGYPGSDAGPVGALDVPALFTQLEKDGEIPPTLFVVPNLNMGHLEPDCVNVAGRPQIETFVVSDVVEAIRTSFPTVTSDPIGWVVAGISSGGYCAPVLALRHPDVFFGAISLGGYDDPQLGAVAQADAVTRSSLTITHMVASTPAADVHLHVAGTPEDPDSNGLVKALEVQRRSGEDLSTDLTVSGGHSWGTWRAQLPAGMRWWSAALVKAGVVHGDEADGSAESGGSADTGGSGDVADEDATPPSGFELRAPLTLVVSAVLTVLFGAGTVVVAGRRRRGDAPVGEGASARPRRRWGRLALAVVGVAATVVCGVATLGIAVNRVEIFFASWSDLAANWSALF